MYCFHYLFHIDLNYGITFTHIHLQHYVISARIPATAITNKCKMILPNLLITVFSDNKSHTWLMASKCGGPFLNNSMSCVLICFPSLHHYVEKYIEKILKVNQQKHNTMAPQGPHHGKLRIKCNVVKVTPHLSLVKTFLAAVKGPNSSFRFSYCVK